jgi:hypothetical protein
MLMTTRDIEVLPPGTAIVARAHDHSWISLSQYGERLKTEAGGHERAVFVVKPGAYTVETDGILDDVEVKELEVQRPVPRGVETSTLELTSDAADTSVIDGVGEIPADGESFCTITITRRPSDQSSDQTPAGTGEIHLRATGGLIMDSRGRRRIRSVRLRAGRAKFRLVAEPNPRLVSVHALERDGASARLEVEFT